MMTLEAGIEFTLPDELAANEPPEARGLRRDEVRLMVSRVREDTITHTEFAKLPAFLERGDVIVVNTSATVNAAFAALRKNENESTSRIGLHISHPLANGLSVIELRQNSAKGSLPLLDANAGEVLRLPGNATARLIEPYLAPAISGGVRLWIADLALPVDAALYATRYGSPIRYSYVQKEWPLSYYQTVFGNEPGSAEMPSAGRAFTQEIVQRLERAGVVFAPLLLHTGVSSLESEELPYPERYQVPRTTAKVINESRAEGCQIIAVGTTVVRALETVAAPDGTVRDGEGWTDLVITPERGLRAVDGMLTGFHAPRASHLLMLEALANGDHLENAYEAALRERYLWHEFGDLHLII